RALGRCARCAPNWAHETELLKLVDGFERHVEHTVDVCLGVRGRQETGAPFGDVHAACDHACVEQVHVERLMNEAQVFIEREAKEDRKSTRLNSSHLGISYAVLCLKKKKTGSTRRHRHT